MPRVLGESTTVLIVAGEASADRYAARVVERLRERVSARRLRFVGTGGDHLQTTGVELIAHVRELASIGPREAVSKLLKYFETYRNVVREVMERRPAAALLLDFPEFNLRLAARLKRAGIPVIYYVSPQIWAWRRYRVRAIRAHVDRMLVILPFETEFYRRHGIHAEFVGHPLLEDFGPRRERSMFLRSLGLDPGRTTLALMPGSRRKEVDYILPLLVGAAAEIGREMRVQCMISVAPTIAPEQVRGILARTAVPSESHPDLRVVTADSRDVLASADFALVKSGTSTLEAALACTPHLVTYRISPISWFAGKILIRSRFKGLANLIADEGIVPELLQNEATPARLSAAALGYLRDSSKLEGMKSRLRYIRERLGEQRASAAVADVLAGYLDA
ncbi:MAG: lipid-A-disaccharide synthase [Acidobacteria bacterium]|nr:lipid-A-disaccharide synthase [Acidobacteriota bacterium]